MDKKLDKSKLMFSNRYLFMMLVPMLIEMVLSVTIGMVDTMMVSQAGEQAVSGVSCVDTLQMFIIQLLQALATGGVVVASQYLGKKDRSNALLAAKELLYIAFALGLLIGGSTLLFRKGLINLIYNTLEKEVFDSALDYLVPIAVSLPFFAVLSTANAISRTSGKTTIIMVVSIVMNIINISGNAFFLFVLHLGALGVGIASLFSRVVGCIIMLVYISKDDKEIYVDKFWKWEFNPLMMKTIAGVAIPSAVEISLFQLGKILISSTVAYIGTSALAAYAVIMNMTQFCIVGSQAVGLAAVSIIGQCIGAREYEQTRYYARKMMALSYMAITTLALLVFFFHKRLVGLYNLTPSTNESIYSVITLFVANCILVWPMSFTMPNILKGTGDVKYTLYISTISMWCFRIILARVLVMRYSFGLTGIYYGFFLDWYFRAFFYFVRFAKGKWKTKAVV